MFFGFFVKVCGSADSKNPALDWISEPGLWGVCLKGVGQGGGRLWVIGLIRMSAFAVTL